MYNIIIVKLIDEHGQFYEDLINQYPCLTRLRNFFQNYWNTRDNYVPSMNPISLCRRNLDFIQRRLADYYFTAKSDGIRMQYITWNHDNHSYGGFVNSKFWLFFVIEGEFIHSIDQYLQVDRQEECILDGEWMMLPNLVPGSNHVKTYPIEQKPEWIGFDCIASNSHSHIKMSFHERQQIVSTFQFPNNNVAMSIKKWHKLTELRELASFDSQGICVRDHGELCDGIIIAHVNGKIHKNKALDNTMYKLKNCHSIDVYQWHDIYWCGCHGNIICFNRSHVERLIIENSKFDSRLVDVVDWPNEAFVYNIPDFSQIVQESTIVELRFVQQYGRIKLEYIKTRLDKINANDIDTILYTAQNCLENIQLIDFV